MANDFALRIYYQSGRAEWRCAEYSQLPVPRPSVIVLHVNHEQTLEAAGQLLEGLQTLLRQLQASLLFDRGQDWHDEDFCETSCLHVIVCLGRHPASIDPSVLQAADKSASRTWILPVFRLGEKDQIGEVLGPDLRERNVAFWEDSILELPLTLLARSGVTTLERRAFISYRRSDTSSIADQLFDALHWRNFDLFLDRVSVEPGVDFQASLFAQLSHKSLVILLNSQNFPNSEWTKAELRFARDRRLSLVILQLPNARDIGATSGEEIVVQAADLQEVEAPGSTEEQIRLRPTALKQLVEQIVFQHDRELIARMRDIRLRVLEAAKLLEREFGGGTAVKVKALPSEHDSTVTLEVEAEAAPPTACKRYTIYPSAYPPDVPELYDAALSSRTKAEKRFVVGHLAAIQPIRVTHLDWIVNGRNVGYHDIDGISVLFDGIAKGEV